MGTDVIVDSSTGIDGDVTIQTTSRVPTRSPHLPSEQPTPIHHQHGGDNDGIVIIAAVSVSVVVIVIISISLVLLVGFKMRRTKRMSYECQTDAKSAKDLEIADSQK